MGTSFKPLERGELLVEMPRDLRAEDGGDVIGDELARNAGDAHVVAVEHRPTTFTRRLLRGDVHERRFAANDACAMASSTPRRDVSRTLVSQ